jgi:hypothetical protein
MLPLTRSSFEAWCSRALLTGSQDQEDYRDNREHDGYNGRQPS